MKGREIFAIHQGGKILEHQKKRIYLRKNHAGSAMSQLPETPIFEFTTEVVKYVPEEDLLELKEKLRELSDSI